MMSTPQATKPFQFPLVTPTKAVFADPPSGMGPQAWSIYKHLQEAGSISNVEAQAVYRCRALPRRIADIEAALAITIRREHKRDATGQRYVRYFLED